MCLVLNSFKKCEDVKIEGQLKKWHRIVLNFKGPQTNEMDVNNPFLNYRLDVTFKNGDNTFVIPGF